MPSSFNISPTSVLAAFQAMKAVHDENPEALKRVLDVKPVWTEAWVEVVKSSATSPDATFWELFKSAWTDEPSFWRAAAFSISDEVTQHVVVPPEKSQKSPTKSQLAQRSAEILHHAKDPFVLHSLIDGLLKLKRPYQVMEEVLKWHQSVRQSVWSVPLDDLPLAFRHLDPMQSLSQKQQRAAHQLLDMWIAEAPLALIVPFVDQRHKNRPLGGTTPILSSTLKATVLTKLDQHTLTADQQKALSELGSVLREDVRSAVVHDLMLGHHESVNCLWGQWFDPKDPQNDDVGATICMAAARMLAGKAADPDWSHLQSSLAHKVLSTSNQNTINAAALMLYKKNVFRHALDALVEYLPPELISTLSVDQAICPILHARQVQLTLTDVVAAPSQARQPSKM